MRYEEFVHRTRDFPIFGQEVLGNMSWKRGAMRLQLTRWLKAEKIIRLKRGLYTLPDDRRKSLFSLRWLANTLYSPSYVSLEYALYWYDMIPEKVVPVSSISVLKTYAVANPLGRFIYRNLKKELFFGFEETLDEFKRPVLMATREKALLDYIYFYKGWQTTEEFLEESIRLQQLETLQKKRLKSYAKKFDLKRISDTVEIILSIT
ncbi:MAG: hypothetical protein HY401_00625 [Elusimicrobia bacterium]|nr:hypothetical protein [Elusimicrobiota bacterium]